MMAKRGKPDWFTCPTCGAKVDEGAAACPECGADDETGWSPDAAYDEVDHLSAIDDEATYKSAERIPERKPWWVIAVIVLLILVSLLWIF